MPPSPQLVKFTWDRVILAVERVRTRLNKCVHALEAAQIPFAVAECQAVRTWIDRVEPSATRYSPEIELLINRADILSAAVALNDAGLQQQEINGRIAFVESEQPAARDAVHIIFAREKIRPEYELAAPDLSNIDREGDYPILGLRELAQMKLTSFRTKDQMHLRDLIDIGLLDASWPERFPESLGTRLQFLLDHPED